MQLVELVIVKCKCVLVGMMNVMFWLTACLFLLLQQIWLWPCNALLDLFSSVGEWLIMVFVCKGHVDFGFYRI